MSRLFCAVFALTGAATIVACQIDTMQQRGPIDFERKNENQVSGGVTYVALQELNVNCVGVRRLLVEEPPIPVTGKARLRVIGGFLRTIFVWPWGTYWDTASYENGYIVWSDTGDRIRVFRGKDGVIHLRKNGTLESMFRNKANIPYRITMRCFTI